MLGGIPALGGGTEHQGYGTPHLHVEVHVASAYQFDSLAEIVQKLQDQRFSMDDWFAYQEWFHAEDVLDKDTKEEVTATLEEDWHSRFSDKKHDDMSVTPAYLVSDAARNLGKHIASANGSAQREI